MRQTITPTQMQAMERDVMARTGMPGLLLMEHAAQAVVRALADYAQAPRGDHALFVCGKGNNGGDGCAAARLWTQAGGRATVWLTADPADMPGDAGTQARLVAHCDARVDLLKSPPFTVPAGVSVVVDALFGTGLSRQPQGIFAALIRTMNTANLPVVAVDIPSGIDGQTGAVLGEAVRATCTVAFHRPKPGHFFYPGRKHAGRLRVADIGLRPAWDDVTGLRILEEGDLAVLLPPRPPEGHKGTFGHALIVAGSVGMAGAAALCAEAALRIGAGLVTVACPASVMPIVQQLAPCAVSLPMPEREGHLAAEAAPLLAQAAQGKQCVAMGPGLGVTPGVTAALAPLWTLPAPRIIDADALNVWSGAPAGPATLDARAVVTPHPGEAGRMLNRETASIVGDPLGAARALRQATGATVLLKGAATVIVDGQDPGSVTLNLTGTDGLATGGSGDVLTGILAGLCAQGMVPYEAASVGAYIHGRAGELCAAAHTPRGMIAADLLDVLKACTSTA